MEQRRGVSIGGFILGFVFAIVLLIVGTYLYLRYGSPPVAVADTPFPMESTIVHIPLDARINRDQRQAPFAVDAAGQEAGAHLYMERCAACHGTPQQASEMAKAEYPTPPQLWEKHGDHGVVGVSDDPAGTTYWKVKNGIRLTGMPSFEHILSEREMWQVSLLLQSANKPMPPAVAGILAGTVGSPGAPK